MLGHQRKFVRKPATNKGSILVTVPASPVNKLPSKWAWVLKLRKVKQMLPKINWIVLIREGKKCWLDCGGEGGGLCQVSGHIVNAAILRTDAFQCLKAVTDLGFNFSYTQFYFLHCSFIQFQLCYCSIIKFQFNQFNQLLILCCLIII